ncbi:glycoside hydrolase family 38 C-terminal domain-containing protein [Chitinophagaceae bacterium 26-R-25]|nr:glycoside hydrolase family 38 C-terminal domain-containing protein [Chitinophagaceae bacterium 26-R-25]
MKKIFFLQVLIIISLVTAAQTDVPWLGKIQWINGYAKAISGESIIYNSPYPGYTDESLITRATDGKKSIEWETSAVPVNAKGPYVYFAWLGSHSSGSSGGLRNFDLYVNDQKLFTFTTYPNNEKRDWTFGAADSSRLVFRQIRTDGRRDAHGYLYLRLPMSRVKPGKPIRIKMIGQNQNSLDYFFTAKFSLEDRVDVRAMPFVLKNGKRPIMLTTIRFGNPQKILVKTNNKESGSFNVSQGFNRFEVAVPQPVGKADSVLVEVFVAGKLSSSKYVQLKPVVDRTLYFIHHSHTDVGYNYLQPEVERVHNKNIDDALKMIDATKNYPAEARFKWNEEAAWVIENWLRQASPEDKQKFIAAVKEGSICLSATYANILTGLSQPEEVFHYTDFAKQLSKQYGITINSAMQSDVPGFAWSTVAGLAKGGVRYFSSGPNFLSEDYPNFGGRVGGFVKTWGDKPVWWVSPSGEQKVLFWTAAKGYSSWARVNPGEVFDKGPAKIGAYMDELAAQQYPYDMVQWRYAIAGDNSIIDTSISRFVAAWNEKYASPKIILSTTEKMFEDFEKKYGDQIPVVKGDISPYWEDGALSSAEETGKNRVNSLRLQQLSTLYSMLNPQKYEPATFYAAWRNIILFHEHTWGANCSIDDPDAPFVKEQWRIKKGFMQHGDTVVNQLTENLLQLITDVRSKKIAVFNTSSWTRTGPVMLPAGTVGKSVKAASGKLCPVQKLNDGRLVFIAENIPALGKALYELTDETTTANNVFVVTDSTLTNGKISLTWNTNNGSITTLKNGNQFNYAGKFNQQGLNSYWYIPGYDPTNAKTNGKVKITVVEAGPVVTTIQMQSSAPGANNLERKISLYANGDQVMIENTIDKIAIRSKEGVQFGFPFDSTLCNTLIDGGYGSMKFLADQLPGSNLDYVCGRRWMDASSANKGIQLLWLQTPMVEPGNIIDERTTLNSMEKDWKTTAQPTANWFSYAMNNYWYTNSKADQSGISKFNYALRPHGTVKQAEMEQAAAEYTQPLVAIPVKENSVKPGGLFELSNNHISVVGITPDAEGGFTVRLFNPEPAALSTNFIWNELKPKQITHAKSGEIVSADKAISIAGMDVVEIRIN